MAKKVLITSPDWWDEACRIATRAEPKAFSLWLKKEGQWQLHCQFDTKEDAYAYVLDVGITNESRILPHGERPE